jgi:E3 ubiquitin-protein ligase RNF216
MDQSGCKEPFIPSQLRRFLPEKLVVLYDRVLANQNVREAGIEGIEECPACDFKCVIDDEEEELFYCHNEACLMVSCRKCKKPVRTGCNTYCSSGLFFSYPYTV